MLKTIINIFKKSRKGETQKKNGGSAQMVVVLTNNEMSCLVQSYFCDLMRSLLYLYL